MSNFIPNEVKRCRPSEPAWYNDKIRNRLRKQNELCRKYKYKGYLSSDKTTMDTFRLEAANIIEATKEKYLMSQGVKLGQKTYRKILNEFSNKTKTPRIPPLFSMVIS